MAVGLLDEHVRYCVATVMGDDSDEGDRIITEATRAIERLVKS